MCTACSSCTRSGSVTLCSASVTWRCLTFGGPAGGGRIRPSPLNWPCLPILPGAPGCPYLLCLISRLGTGLLRLPVFERFPRMLRFLEGCINIGTSRWTAGRSLPGGIPGVGPATLLGLLATRFCRRLIGGCLPGIGTSWGHCIGCGRAAGVWRGGRSRSIGRSRFG